MVEEEAVDLHVLTEWIEGVRSVVISLGHLRWTWIGSCPVVCGFCPCFKPVYPIPEYLPRPTKRVQARSTTSKHSSLEVQLS